MAKQSAGLSRNGLISLLAAIGILFAATNTTWFLLYSRLSDSLDQVSGNLTRIETKHESAAAELETSIIAEEAKREQQVTMLRNSLMDTIMSLEDQLREETRSLQSNIESVQLDVGGLREQSEELAERVSDIDVSSSDFSSIIQDLMRSVVNIQTDIGYGSGFFVTDDGFIMTNFHVVEGAEWVNVQDYDGNYYRASIIGYASDADLAVLKADLENVDHLRFDTTPEVGQRVVAIGNPQGLSFTVTEGIISALERQIDQTGVGYIQTDVPINQGNSGGPLIGSNGRVVGVNTLKLSASEGIGFAIPGDLTEEILEQAIEVYNQQQ